MAKRTKIVTLNLTPATIAIACGVVFVIMCLTYLLIAFTPLRRTVPGYPTEESRQKAMENLVKMDSLERVMNMWAFQVENIRRIADGRKPLSPDSLSSTAPGVASVENRNIYASEDSILRSEVLRQERLEIPAGTEQRHIEQMEGLIFFTPVKGLLTKAFDTDLHHPYVDIAAPSGTMVYSILDGTVISVSMNSGKGYNIEVMHDGDIVSIYKYCEKLLKRVGDKVTAGTPIAVTGDPDDRSRGDMHIHFELWHKGEAIDPTLYIKF